MSRLKRRSSVGPRQGPAPPPPPMLQEKSLSMDTDDSLLSGGEEEVERKRRHERGANKRHSLAHHHVAAMQQGAATPQGTPVAGSGEETWFCKTLKAAVLGVEVQGICQGGRSVLSGPRTFLN